MKNIMKNIMKILSYVVIILKFIFANNYNCINFLLELTHFFELYFIRN